MFHGVESTCACAGMSFNVKALVQTLIQLFLLDCLPATATKHYVGDHFGQGPRFAALSDGFRWILVKLTDKKLFVSPVFAADTWTNLEEILGMLVHALTNGQGIPQLASAISTPISHPSAQGDSPARLGQSSPAVELIAAATPLVVASNRSDMDGEPVEAVISSSVTLATERRLEHVAISADAKGDSAFVGPAKAYGDVLLPRIAEWTADHQHSEGLPSVRHRGRQLILERTVDAKTTAIATTLSRGQRHSMVPVIERQNADETINDIVQVTAQAHNGTGDESAVLLREGPVAISPKSSLTRHLWRCLRLGTRTPAGVFIDHHVARSEAAQIAVALQKLGLRVVYGRSDRSDSAPMNVSRLNTSKKYRTQNCSSRVHSHVPLPSDAGIVIMDTVSPIASHALKHLAIQIVARTRNQPNMIDVGDGINATSIAGAEVWVVAKHFVSALAEVKASSSAVSRLGSHGVHVDGSRLFARQLSRAVRRSFVWHSSDAQTGERGFSPLKPMILPWSRPEQ